MVLSPETLLEGSVLTFLMVFVSMEADSSFFGKVPFPLSNQYKSTSGKEERIFVTKSRLGLFRPERICEMLDRCTPIFSAKDEDDNP